MAKVGRNRACPCASGKKAKRCCGVRGGPSDESLARAFVAVHARQSLALMVDCDETEFSELFEEMLDLPEHHLALAAPLLRILTPGLQRLARAVSDEDHDEVESTVEAALPEFDTPMVRAHLARALVAEREAGRIGARLAAVALFDLANRSVALLRSALLQAVAVASGATATPCPGGASAGFAWRRMCLIPPP